MPFLGCEYGDKFLDCNKRFCGSASYARDCCSTCGLAPPPVIRSVTTTTLRPPPTPPPVVTKAPVTRRSKYRKDRYVLGPDISILLTTSPAPQRNVSMATVRDAVRSFKADKLVCAYIFFLRDENHSLTGSHNHGLVHSLRYKIKDK